MSGRHVRTAGVLTSAVAVLLGTGVIAGAPAQAAVGCAVTYSVSSQWSDGFGATVTVTNLGDPITGWNLEWTFAAGQRVGGHWNAAITQAASSSQVAARNLSYNATLGTGGRAEFGFNGTWTGSNPVPASFQLNGTTCTGSVDSGPGPGPGPGPNPGPGLPSSFQWSSSGVLAGPRPDAQHSGALAVKDFSVVRHNNQWLVYATTASPSGWGLIHYAFNDWPQAASASHTYLDTASAIGPGYRAAPQLFFFAPQNLWYLVYQSAPPTYSTSTNPADPRSWSAPRTFIAQEPPIVTQNKGPGQWIDFWVICDGATCFLFFSDDNGHIYRAQTSQASFPNGFGNTQIVLSDSRFALFEATNVYKIANRNQYLLLQEAIGSDGKRWFRSYTSTSLTGTWTPLANTEANPFARSNNVTFPGGAWTRDISHGELIRATNDQTLTINPCRLQLVYQGMDPAATGEYIRLPWRMGLLTQTNSPC